MNKPISSTVTLSHNHNPHVSRNSLSRVTKLLSTSFSQLGSSSFSTEKEPACSPSQPSGRRIPTTRVGGVGGAENHNNNKKSMLHPLHVCVCVCVYDCVLYSLTLHSSSYVGRLLLLIFLFRCLFLAAARCFRRGPPVRTVWSVCHSRFSSHFLPPK